MSSKTSRKTIQNNARPLGTKLAKPVKTPNRVAGAKHDWEKSNLITIMKGGHVYDTARCKTCGATGKRFGLSEHIVADSKRVQWCFLQDASQKQDASRVLQRLEDVEPEAVAMFERALIADAAEGADVVDADELEAFAARTTEKSSSDAQKVVDNGSASDVEFVQMPNVASTIGTPTNASETTPTQENRQMTLTLKGYSKNGKTAFYSGAATVLRFVLSAFPGKAAPQTIDVPDGTFAAPKPTPVAMTPEEKAAAAAARKAANALKPKPTLAERIAAREAALEKLRAKLATDNAAPAQF